ncbi:MAG: hypothetical protein SO144_03525 [Campylobacter sp.]|nr:hypothetical protein [Campylobacter sp.]
MGFLDIFVGNNDKKKFIKMPNESTAISCPLCGKGVRHPGLCKECAEKNKEQKWDFGM